MKRIFQYFDLSLGEQRGFILLSSITLISLIIPIIHGFFQKDELLQHELIFLEGGDFTKYDIRKERETELIKSEYGDILGTLKSFDPNGLRIEEWIGMGLSRQQAQVIKNYEAKGGTFKRKEDVSKIYSISQRDYKRLEPFINITKDTTHKRIIEGSYQKNERKKYSGSYADLRVDISKSDSSEFTTLKGIGPILSSRIIRFRESLGGFVGIEQIKEVYGLSEETYNAIRSHLILGDKSIRKLKINLLTKEDLAKHPYVSNKEAQWIVNYREQHGAFKNIESLYSIEMLNRDFLRKIEPYLDF